MIWQRHVEGNAAPRADVQRDQPQCRSPDLFSDLSLQHYAGLFVQPSRRRDCPSRRQYHGFHALLVRSSKRNWRVVLTTDPAPACAMRFRLNCRPSLGLESAGLLARQPPSRRKWFAGEYAAKAAGTTDRSNTNRPFRSVLCGGISASWLRPNECGLEKYRLTLTKHYRAARSLALRVFPEPADRRTRWSCRWCNQRGFIARCPPLRAAGPTFEADRPCPRAAAESAPKIPEPLSAITTTAGARTIAGGDPCCNPCARNARSCAVRGTYFRIRSRRA